MREKLEIIDGTPVEIKSARLRLGLTQAQLAERMRLGKDGKRIVRGWEKGERKPSGPVLVALGYMLAERAPEGPSLAEAP